MSPQRRGRAPTLFAQHMPPTTQSNAASVLKEERLHGVQGPDCSRRNGGQTAADGSNTQKKSGPALGRRWRDLRLGPETAGRRPSVYVHATRHGPPYRWVRWGRPLSPCLSHCVFCPRVWSRDASPRQRNPGRGADPVLPSARRRRVCVTQLSSRALHSATVPGPWGGPGARPAQSPGPVCDRIAESGGRLGWGGCQEAAPGGFASVFDRSN